MPKRHKVLITGSSGMLGTDLSQELSGGYDVAGTDVVRVRGPGAGVQKFYQGDITDKDSIAGVIKDSRPDVVIHTAAWTDVDGCELDKDKAYRVNSDGAANVAEACKDSGAVIVHISTDFVFDGTKRTPYIETDPTGPLSIYGDSKLKGEEAVRRATTAHYILRTSWLYGRNGKNFVDTIVAKAKDVKELKVVDDQVGSPTYTVDLARAIHALLERVQGPGSPAPFASLRGGAGRVQGFGIYHVSNSGSVSWFDYAKTILELAGMKTPVLPISSKELNRPARRPAMSVLDTARFRDLTGFTMRDWKAALREYLGQ